MSGVWIADTANNTHRSASRALPFFLTQATAIIFERGVIHVANKTLGLRDAWYWRVVG